MMIFLLPAILAQKIARFIAGFIEEFISDDLGEWFYITFAFPFQADSSLGTSLIVSLFGWVVLADFIFRLVQHVNS